MSMPSLSIIVPSYNADKYLQRCINSLLHQDIQNAEYEIIIIDDGSTDKTLEIAHEFEGRSENITVISQTNQGQSAARNAGLNIAKGLYVWFVDGDDYIEENCLSGLLNECMKVDVDEYVFGLKKQLNKNDMHYSRQCIQPVSLGVVMSGLQALVENYQPASAGVYLYKRQFIEEYNLRFAQKLWQEDVDFNLHAIAYAKKVIFTDKTPYFYCYNDNSSSTKNDLDSVKKHLFDEVEVANRAKTLMCKIEN